MPTNLHNPRQGTRERYFARQAVYRQAKQAKHTQVLTAPWMGWVPDLPPHLVGWRGYRNGQGLIAAPYLGRGLYVRHDDGFEQLNAATLPLSTGGYAIVGLAQFRDTNLLNANTPIAITAGGGAVDNVFAQYATGAWVAIAANAAIPNAVQLDRDTTFDHCVFPFGAPARADGNLGWPVVILCGSDDTGPTCRVLVYPDDTAVAACYDELQHAVAPGASFMAASCESFNGRVHFFNTIESAAGRNPTRHRWTAVGTADPDETIVGSGYMDFAESQRQGRRIAAMRDKLVLYFEDGVAFQIPTGSYFDAYRPQLVSGSRGLLGTQAMCAISPHLHFGIFSDGWYTLDSSGRWSESGRLILEETRGKSHELTKWKSSFYEDLDFEQKHRICCVYDNYRKTVRIAYPSKSTNSENYAILNYHWPTDTCWRDKYAKPVTAWGQFDIQTNAGLTWNAAPGTWDAAAGTWDDYAPQFRENVVVHGCGTQSMAGGLTGGYVFGRDPSMVTYDNASPFWYYQSHFYNQNQNPLLRQTFHRLGVEYMSMRGSMQVGVGTDEFSYAQLQAIPLNEGNDLTIQNAYGHFRLDGTDLGFTIQGYGPVAIRSIVAELMMYGSEDREGQV